jgi:protein gp37
VIAGGTSGPKWRAQPMDVDWARSLRDQCLAAGVAFYFKQMSGLRPGMGEVLDGQCWHQFPTP